MNKDLITAELARRELARRYYSEYLAYSYGDSWIRTRMSAYLAGRIQKFIEADTGKYEIEGDAEVIITSIPSKA